LLLADVMMPQLDGFALLRTIRGDAALGSLPVILLSARAGEESRVEGLKAGADDYLVKPFTARELLARVEVHLKMANLRRETAEREERLRMERALKEQLYRENLALRDEVDRTSMFEEIVGSSNSLKLVLSRIAKVAPTDSTVLLLGKPGQAKSSLLAPCTNGRNGLDVASSASTAPPSRPR